MSSVTVFVGDLSFFCSEADLVKLFSEYGRVERAIIRRSREGTTLNYGFVTMARDQCRPSMVEELEGRLFLGRHLRVNIQSNGTSKLSSSPKTWLHQVYVRFQSDDSTIQVDEVKLLEIFSVVGSIADCIVKEHSIMAESNRMGGYAFLYFQEKDSAVLAVAATYSNSLDPAQSVSHIRSSLAAAEQSQGVSPPQHGLWIDGVVYKCSFPKGSSLAGNISQSINSSISADTNKSQSHSDVSISLSPSLVSRSDSPRNLISHSISLPANLTHSLSHSPVQSHQHHALYPSSTEFVVPLPSSRENLHLWPDTTTRGAASAPAPLRSSVPIVSNVSYVNNLPPGNVYSPSLLHTQTTPTVLYSPPPTSGSAIYNPLPTEMMSGSNMGISGTGRRIVSAQFQPSTNVPSVLYYPTSTSPQAAVVPATTPTVHFSSGYSFPQGPSMAHSAYGPGILASNNSHPINNTAVLQQSPSSFTPNLTTVDLPASLHSSYHPVHPHALHLQNHSQQYHQHQHQQQQQHPSVEDAAQPAVSSAVPPHIRMNLHPASQYAHLVPSSPIHAYPNLSSTYASSHSMHYAVAPVNDLAAPSHLQRNPSHQTHTISSAPGVSYANNNSPVAHSNDSTT